MPQTDRLIHLVDDDETIRRSASFMLRTSGYLVKTYESGVQFLEQSAGPAPGCILLDIRMPGMDGLEVQRALKARHMLHPVVVMTGHGDVAIAVQAMKAGAVDFIEKPFPKSQLLDALERAFEWIGQAGQRRAQVEEASARLAALTSRELDVLRGLVRGQPNKTIAYDLGISPRTVEIHRANLMTKLEVSSLSEALRIAFAAGLDDEEGEAVA
ncbi:MAG TPA: response regulator transcription factor [Allosphingosinicella sp.]|nr:response regulator transcription factor [Allosphingosinicella sp.]